MHIVDERRPLQNFVNIVAENVQFVVCRSAFPQYLPFVVMIIKGSLAGCVLISLSLLATTRKPVGKFHMLIFVL